MSLHEISQTTEMPTRDQIGFAISIGKDPDKIKCWDCLDGETYPYYGMAPHQHIETGDAKVLHVRDGQPTWPANFEIDPDIDLGGKSPDEYTGPIAGIFYCPNEECENSLKQRLGDLGPGPWSGDREYIIEGGQQ